MGDSKMDIAIMFLLKTEMGTQRRNSLGEKLTGLEAWCLRCLWDFYLNLPHVQPIN